MEQDLSRIVRAFTGKKVLLVGDLILDRYVYGDAERISPEAPVPVLRVVDSHEAVGGSANVASCLTALGVEVVCCGLVGRDAHGTTLQSLLEGMGVSTSGVVADGSRPTTAKTRLVGLAQHRHRQQLLRVDEEETSALSDELSARLMKSACLAVSEVDVVCLEDYDKGVITESLAAAVVAEAKRQGKPVLVDPARLTDYSRYRGVDLITPNRVELSLAAGKNCDLLEDVAPCAERLLGEMGITAAAVTVDRDGAVLVRRGQPSSHLPTIPRSVYDNTGAGDAVLAMLAACVAVGADLEDAVRLSNVAGGLEVERFGCVPITADEVLAEIRLERRRQGGKLRRPEELVAELSIRRDRGETVAFTNGCFDILHAGHVDFLQRCRQQGSILVVGLNSDASVRNQDKGSDRPINPFELRAAVLGALECTDYIVGFEDSTPEALIREVRPDVLAKGEDWAGKGVVGQEFVESYGGKVVLLPLLEGLSTTALVDRIRKGRS